MFEKIESERASKEKSSALKSQILEVPSRNMEKGHYTLRVFSDGTAYALDGFGGKYQKWSITGVWDYVSPDGNTYSRADVRFAEDNKMINEIWETLQ